MKKHFSIRYKLIIIFGTLILTAGTVEGFFAVRTARKAVTEKVKTNLIDKATDAAEIIDGRINTMFQFLEGIARMPQLRDVSVPYSVKLDILKKEAAFNETIIDLQISDTQGNTYTVGGTISDKDALWYKTVVSGHNSASEPFTSAFDGSSMLIIFSVPVYDNNHTVIGTLNSVIKAEVLSDQIKDIVVGKTGYCYVLGPTGTVIAHKLGALVADKANAQEKAKTDETRVSLANFEKNALESEASSVGYYEYNGISNIASYAHLKNAPWMVVIKAPQEEFMGTVNELRLEMILIGIGILLSALLIVYFVARAVVKPVQTVVSALQNIA